MSIRAVDVVRASLGVADAVGSEYVGMFELGRGPDATERTVYRVLGVRQLVQAGVTALGGSRGLGVAVDVLHAASMVALAAKGPATLRRGAVIQATIATGLAVWGGIVAATDD